MQRATIVLDDEFVAELTVSLPWRLSEPFERSAILRAPACGRLPRKRAARALRCGARLCL